MKKIVPALTLSLLAATPFLTFAATNQVETNQVGQQIDHVIYITLDGTRWQDIYNKKQFPILWKKYADQITFYGKPKSGVSMEAASTPVSLPSYQAQLSGRVQPHCEENDCGRIKVETFAEYLVQADKLKKTDVVTFGSWAKINYAVEHIPGTTLTYVGNYPVIDPTSNQADATMASINKQQAIDHPELDPEDGPERFDKYTFAQALHFYEKYQPKFMWISLVDADEAAHANDIKTYRKTMALYDQSLDQLFTTLKDKQWDKNTMIIVTTDHGRGNGKNWVDHGDQLPESKRTWAFVMNGKLLAPAHSKKKNSYSTLSIRPTVESVFTTTKAVA